MVSVHNKHTFLSFLKQNIDKTFLGLVIFTAIIDLPFFLNIVLPLHDTMISFHIFYFFYNNLYWYNEIAQWLPFGFYGMHSDFYVMSLTPLHYLVGLFGWVFRIENALLLFKIATFFEHLLLLFGTYLLSMTLFKRKAVAALVSLAVIGCTAMITQISWNLHIYYLLPLLIYFLLRFFETFKPQYLVTAMIMYTFSVFGGVYMSMVNVLALTALSLVLLMGNIKSWRKVLALTKRDIALSVFLSMIFVIYIGSFYYFAKNAMDYTEIFSIGRDPLTGMTDLNTFLTYGGHIGFGKFLTLLSPKPRLISFAWGITAYDLSLYIGLIPLVLVLFGAIRFRNAVYLSLVSVVATLGLFSMGGRFSEVLYNYFLPIRYYRHIGLAVSGYKVLLPLLAGYGIKLCLDWIETSRERLNIKRSLVLETIIAAVLLISGMTHYQTIRAVIQPQYHNAALLYGAVVAALVVILYLVKRYFQPSKHFVLFLVLCMLAEIFIYQAELMHGFERHSQRMKPIKEDAVRVKEYNYQGMRTITPIPGRAIAAVPLMWGTTTYNFGYNFLQWDPCIIQARTDSINDHVATLIKVRGGNFSGMQVHMPADNVLLNALGCGSPKLKLFTNAIYTDNDNDAIKYMASIKSPNDAVVLGMVSPENRQNSTSPTGSGTIRVTDFRANALNLEVEAPEEGAWLYYADAWHPYWKAKVNGKNTNIALANLAFKAVRLDGGHNEVNFYIDGGVSSVCLAVIVIIGLLIAIILVSAIGLAVFKPSLLYGDYSNSG